MDLKVLTIEQMGLVRAQIVQALDILRSPGLSWAWQDADKEIDAKRDDIVNRSFDIMSLQQPRPQDLRWILGFQRIAQELERVADYACDLGELNALKLKGAWPPGIDEMGKHLLVMLDYCLDAVVKERDIDHDMDDWDEPLDSLYNNLKQELIHGPGPRDAESGIVLILARTLERMGDHVVNVGEMLLYIRTGHRHLKSVPS